MHRDFTFRRRAIMICMGALLLADLALAGYSWHMAATPKTPDEALARQTWHLKVLSAEIDHASKIKADLPATMTDCDRFEKSLLPADTGYSRVSAELGDLAKKSGLNMQGVSFHQSDVKDRPLYAVDMDAQVSGSYESVVHFINGLQRSDEIYVVESLALASDTKTGGPAAGDLLRVTVKMRTYFRTNA